MTTGGRYAGSWLSSPRRSACARGQGIVLPRGPYYHRRFIMSFPSWFSSRKTLVARRKVSASRPPCRRPAFQLRLELLEDRLVPAFLTSTTLSSSPSTSFFGQAVTFTATVGAVAPGT